MVFLPSQEVLLNLGRMDDLARQDSPIHRLDGRIKVLTALFFIVCVVSFPPYTLGPLLPFFVYPLFVMSTARLPAGLIGKRLLVLSPLAILVGLFNPLLDRQPLLQVGTASISGGWVSFVSILLRFVLTVGSLLTLTASTGIETLCAALQQMKVPRLFVLQILFLYRYLFVLTEEAARLLRARSLRSFGRQGNGLAIFRSMAGSLLLRSLQRAEAISRAMYCRAFEGRIPIERPFQLTRQDILFFCCWTFLFGVFRWGNPIGILVGLIQGPNR
jgi:cobalt/nickel transport system permease protein